jgi:transketolase
MSNMHLVDITTKSASEPIRKGFGRGLLKAGQKNEQVVAVCADLTESTQMHLFAEAFPERYIDVGVAEQNLATVGAGLAAMGKIPFVSSYAAFSPGRNWEQIRTTIALNNQPVRVIGSHAGISVGPDGATHQSLEDIALMRVMPNMMVFAPCDSVEAEKITIALAGDARPAYMRLAREATPVFTTENTPFEIGRAYVFAPGDDVTLIATGTMTAQALLAAERLFKDGISAEVIHVPTIKPLDTETILHSVRKTGAVVTLEEAQIAGGLGGAVAELLAEQLPTVMRRIGIHDSYGESGTMQELFHHFKLDEPAIVAVVHELLESLRKA